MLTKTAQCAISLVSAIRPVNKQDLLYTLSPQGLHTQPQYIHVKDCCLLNQYKHEELDKIKQQDTVPGSPASLRVTVFLSRPVGASGQSIYH